MSVSNIVTKPEGRRLDSSVRRPRSRSDCSWWVMNPTGTILNVLAALRSRLRARSRAASALELGQMAVGLLGPPHHLAENPPGDHGIGREHLVEVLRS